MDTEPTENDKNFWAPTPLKVMLDNDELTHMELDNETWYPLLHFDARVHSGRFAGQRTWIDLENPLYRVEQLIFEFPDVARANSFMNEERLKIQLLGEPYLDFDERFESFNHSASYRFWDGRLEPILKNTASDTTINYASTQGVGVTRIVLCGSGWKQDCIPIQQINNLFFQANRWLQSAGIRS